VCRDDVLALCPGPDCPLPVTIASPEDAIAFCACDDPPPTEILTGIEGNVRIEAPQGDVDLRGTSVRAGENIDITAADELLLADASVQNCGPKTGTVTIAGATCDVSGAFVRPGSGRPGSGESIRPVRTESQARRLDQW